MNTACDAALATQTAAADYIVAIDHEFDALPIRDSYGLGAGRKQKRVTNGTLFGPRSRIRDRMQKSERARFPTSGD